MKEDDIFSLARHYMNEHVVPIIQHKSDDTYFICIGKDETKGYYASILDPKQISDQQALEMFGKRESHSTESLIKIIVDFDLMEYNTAFLVNESTRIN